MKQAEQVIANLRAEIVILEERIEELEERDRLLSALEAGGVDNWEGYEPSMEDFNEN